MPRVVTAEDFRARLGRELDALRASEDALYVSKRGRLAREAPTASETLLARP